MRLLLKSPSNGEQLNLCLAGAGWNPCDQTGHVPSTATEKWEQTASSHAAPALYRGLKTPSWRSDVTDNNSVLFCVILKMYLDECLESTLHIKNMKYGLQMFHVFRSCVKSNIAFCNKWVRFRYFVCAHVLYVKSIYSRLTGIKPCTLLKCSTRATICRRAGCCGIGLFAKRAAGSGAFEGVSAIFEQGMVDAS